MQELILHVGRHKTGTTHLQRFLAHNDTWLLEQGKLLYAKAGRAYDAHHPVFWSLVNDGQALDREILGRVIAEAQARPEARLLLSTETLSRTELGTEHLAAVRDAFAGFRITVVIYLRRQDRYLESAYAEHVKRGLLAYPRTIDDLDLALDYEEFIGKYEQVFGSGRVVVRSYEKARGVGLCRDFLTLLGVEWRDTLELPKDANRRMPWLFVEALRYTNRLGIRETALVRRALVYAMNRAGRRICPYLDWPKPLKPEDRQRILRRFQASNSRVARQYLGCDELF